MKEAVMERTELNEDLIELGAVSVETQGLEGDEIEGFVRQPKTGVSDD